VGLTITASGIKKLKGANFMLCIFPVAIAATPQYATGGELVNLKIYVNKDPVAVIIKNTSGYEQNFIKATSKVMLLQGAAGAGPNTEFTNATNYPAGLVADTQVEIWAFYAN
jgi:hypothetical protein